MGQHIRGDKRKNIVPKCWLTICWVRTFLNYKFISGFWGTKGVNIFGVILLWGGSTKQKRIKLQTKILNTILIIKTPREEEPKASNNGDLKQMNFKHPNLTHS